MGVYDDLPNVGAPAATPAAPPADDPYAALPNATSQQAVATPAPAPVDPYSEIPTDPAWGGYPSVSKPWAVTRGFVSGMLEQNPAMAGEALEGLRLLAPESMSGVLGSGSTMFRDLAGRAPGDYKRTTGSMWDIKGIGDAFSWAGETLGSGVASSVPSIVTGGAGALAGAATPIPGGAVAGGLAGAAVPSYLMNYGEVYKALKDEKLDPKLAAKYAAAATVPITALDVGSLASIVGRFGGAVDVAKKEIIKGMARRIAVHAAEGGGTEGVTESLQGAIKDLTVLGTTDKVFSPIEFGKERIEDFAGGAITGGAMSAPAGIRSGRSSEVPTPAEINQAFTGLTGDPSIVAPAPVAPLDPTMPAPGTSPIERSLNGPPLDPTDILPPSPTAPNVSRLVQPPDEVRPPNAVPAEVIDFLSRKAAKLNPETESLAPQREEITATPGANTARLARLLGPKLYGDPTNMDRVTVKEILQNSFDAIKGMLEKNELGEGKIAVNMDTKKRTIQVYDNGSGMTPEVLAKQFLEIAGTHKESERSSGGLGIAKMLFLFGNKGLDVKTMRNGKVARLSATGEQLFAAMDDQSKAPKIQISAPTAAERQLFKDGHGTVIQVTVPESFEDPSSGTSKPIDFETSAYYHPVIRRSPLFDNIEVTWNGQVLDGSSFVRPAMGKHFPIQDYTQFANAKFEWGTARIYVTQAEDKDAKENAYGDNMHILSNGLWQFDSALKLDPTQPYGKNVPYRFYVDINPTVKPEEAGYPFDLNRQQFAKLAKDDLGKIFTYMSVLYNHEDMANSSRNFGNIHYLGMTTDGKLSKSARILLEPKQTTATPANMIRPGDKVSVVGGKLVVNGRKIPTLEPKDVEKFIPNTNELKVDQNEINPNQVLVHDNVVVRISDVEAKSVVQLGEEKFGLRFDDYLFGLGEAFRELRDAVARTMKYPELLREGIGISFDQEYRGVSIRLPFSGSFINPALPEYSDPLRAAVGMVGTMVHELAHHRVRSHNADFPAEMQRLLIHLYIDKRFDFFSYMQKVVSHVAQNKDIHDYINGLFSGTYAIEPSGRRFEDSRNEQAGDASPSGAMAQAGSSAEGGPNVPPGTGTGPATLGRSSRQRDSSLRITEARIVDFLQASEANGRALRMESGDPEMDAVPMQRENQPLKDTVSALFQATSPKRTTGGGPTVPPGVVALAAHGDAISKYYKYGMGLDRLVDRFPTFAPLMRYAERVREMKLDSSKIQDAALRIAKAWRSLGERAEPLAALIDDIANMNYRTPAEVARGIARHPTAAEFQALVAQHKVSPKALRVFQQQKDFFHGFLKLVVENAYAEAKRTITDPVKLADKLDAIRGRWLSLSSRPYFPFLRFGRFYAIVKDQSNQTVFFQTYERKGVKSAERVQKEAIAKLEKGLPAGHTVKPGVLPETATPFIGLPPELLESIQTQLNLTGAQKDAMEQIRYEMSPAASFAHRFQHKNYTPGYSHDFLRAFSRYAFHGARYYSRTKYAWALRQEISAAKAIGGNQAGTIADYMTDHLHKTILDSKGDYGLFKGAIFLWVFGYSVAGASINLTQVPFLTYPFLASRFGGIGMGDLRAQKALAKAALNLKNFYKKGTYENQTAFEMKAIDYGIKTGRITEAQASELAGLAQGQNLLGMGKNKVGRGIQWFLENGAKLFEFSEQFNRRVTYRAALDLAIQQPNSQGVKEAVNKHADEFNQLVATGFNPAEAKAIVTAAYVTEQTQFNYSRENRPRFMRGKAAGTFFVFQNYILNVIQLLGANKGSVMPRYLLMMMAFGGLMGLPGAEDAEHLINLLGKKIFGKDFKVQLWLRELLQEFVGDKADLVLHGLSRRGYGLPALLDMIGEHPGRGLGSVDASQASGFGDTLGGMKHSQNIPAPVLDRSKAVSMGRILPVDIEKLFDPGKDINKALAEQGQRASGAILGVGFNLYRALFDIQSPEGDVKRWEQAMPRALASVSRAYRAFDEGRERGKGGPSGAATLVPYDVRDTEQMAEVIALAMGYTPLRQAAKWDSIMATQEVNASFDLQREILLKQNFEASAGGRQEEIDKVKSAIMDYNEGLPDWAQGKKITGEGADRSLDAHYRDRDAKEAGLPSARQNTELYRRIQSLFPESVVDVRRVK